MAHRLVDHAQRELRLLGEDPTRAHALLEAVKAFYAHRGRSGDQGEHDIELLRRLLRGEALTPLTSNPKEWNDVTSLTNDGKTWHQNKRDPRALSNDGGQTWWYGSARHPGERARDGGEDGVIVACDGCGGGGVLFKPDREPATDKQPEPESAEADAAESFYETAVRALRPFEQGRYGDLALNAQRAGTIAARAVLEALCGCDGVWWGGDHVKTCPLAAALGGNLPQPVGLGEAD